MLRADVFRDEDFFAVARPPRAPAVRTDIVPRPLVDRDDAAARVDDFLAVARPPFAPAFFFCARVPARPPFAPAAFTDIVPRPDVFRAGVEVFLRDDVEELFRAEVERDVVRDDVLVFLRDDVPPPPDELELRDDLDEDDLVSPD